MDELHVELLQWLLTATKGLDNPAKVIVLANVAGEIIGEMAGTKEEVDMGVGYAQGRVEDAALKQWRKRHEN